jgi:glucosylceramidase
MVDRIDPDKYWYIPEYWLLGQISKFLQRGAMRIDSDYGSHRTVTNAAFLNPDGTIALIAVNQTRREQHVTFVMPDAQVDATIPGKTVATYIWPHS